VRLGSHWYEYKYGFVCTGYQELHYTVSIVTLRERYVMCTIITTYVIIDVKTFWRPFLLFSCQNDKLYTESTHNSIELLLVYRTLIIVNGCYWNTCRLVTCTRVLGLVSVSTCPDDVRLRCTGVIVARRGWLVQAWSGAAWADQVGLVDGERVSWRNSDETPARTEKSRWEAKCHSYQRGASHLLTLWHKLLPYGYNIWSILCKAGSSSHL